MNNLFINLRKQHGLTQTELARIVGVSRVTVSRWENSKVQPNPLTLRTLSYLTRNHSYESFGPGVAKTAARDRSVRKHVAPAVFPASEQQKALPAGVNRFRGVCVSAYLTRVEIFRKSPIFANLDNKYLCELSELAIARQFKAHEFLYFTGDPVECCYMVSSGMVKMVKHSSSGTDLVTSIFGPGEMLGSTFLFTGKIQASSAQAMGETNVLIIRNKDFVSFLDRYPLLSVRIYQELLAVAGKRIQAAMVRLGQLAAERTDYRLAWVLFDLCLRLGPHIPLTRREIAEISGTTTETTARFMSRLAQAGIVQSSRGKVTVKDQDRLRQLAEAS